VDDEQVDVLMKLLEGQRRVGWKLRDSNAYTRLIPGIFDIQLN
jgi:hypothetical protein